MKKIILLFMLFFAVPLTCFAASVDTDELKGKLGLPLYYVKTAQNIEMNQTSSLVSISWSGERDGEGGTVSVKVDEQGRIVYYNGYEYGNFEGDFHLSSMNQTEAAEAALLRLKEICPEFAGELKLYDGSNYIARTKDYYSIKFVRYVNDIPYYSNYITASVHAGTGELVEFNVVWDDIDKNEFPYPAPVVKKEKAKEYLKKNIGLTLGNTKSANGEFVLQYFFDIIGPTYISAYTGEVITTDIRSGKYSYDTSLFVKSMSALDREVISYSSGSEFGDVEQILRKQLELGADFELQAVAVQENSIHTKYLLFLFADSKGASVTAEISLLTKEITLYLKSFSQEGNYSGISRDKAKAKAVAFVKKMGDKRYKNLASPQTYDGYTYLFRRILEDGTVATDNGIAVTVDSVTGEISSYVCSWEYNGFNGYADVVDEEAAYSELFSRGDFSLMYVATAKRGIREAVSSDDISINLVYGFRPEVPLFVDAKCGSLVYSDNTEYSEDTVNSFTDIEGHVSEKYINKLADAGVIDISSNKFNPDAYMTQSEYLAFLYRAVKCEDIKDVVALYEKMVYEYGVIDEDEVSENSKLNFENAIKYAVRILGYEEVAELKGIYSTLFVDEASISPELVGYAAIAKGLGIVKGNAFAPQQTLTKAIAAEIVYNAVAN